VTEQLDPECFPEQLEALAREVTTFLDTLNEFPEFTDEAVNASILSFEGDLKVRGAGISFFFRETTSLLLVLVVLPQGICGPIPIPRGATIHTRSQ